MRGSLPTRAAIGTLTRSVVIVGMPGAGKTAVGRALATRLKVPFRDSDAEIEAAAQASIPEIFARDGEAFFRNRESAVIARLLDGAPTILSTGGGAWLQPANRALIVRVAVALWLKADLDLLWQRVRHKDTRPLLRTPDPKATLAALLEERAPVYAAAPLVVRTQPDWSIEATRDAVLARLAAAGLVERRP